MNSKRIWKWTLCIFLALNGVASATPTEEAKKPPQERKAKKMTAIIHTSVGDVTLKLFPETAPKTVENFVGLANGTKSWKQPGTGKKMEGTPLYNDTIFHRVIPGFMVQCGDPAGNGTGGPGYQFADETGPSDNFDKPGILAMANAGPNTNGSQFFITVKATPWLNRKHTIFGEVTSGMDVVEKIVNSPRDEMDRPREAIKIKSIKVH